MDGGKSLAFALILCGIVATTAEIPLPRKHIIDFSTFDLQVSSLLEYYKWKALWQFTVNLDSTVRFTYGMEYRFEIHNGIDLIRHDRHQSLSNGACSESFTESAYPFESSGQIAEFYKKKRFSSSKPHYLALLSTNPSKYVWMYECGAILGDGTNCTESETSIWLLFNQGNDYSKRPEGLPWKQALQDLYQATKVRLDEVHVDNADYGTWRAAYKYKPINEGAYTRL